MVFDLINFKHIEHVEILPQLTLINKEKMKKIIKLSLIVIVFFSTTLTFSMEGKDNYTLNIITGEGKVMRFSLDATKKISFSIYDINNNLLYNGECGDDKLEVSKTITLEGYLPGSYILELKEENKTIRHKIKVEIKNEKALKLDPKVNESPSFRR